MSERLAELLAERTPVPGHRPWPRYEIDEADWLTIAQELGKGGGDLLGLWGEKDNVHLALRVAGAAAPCVVSLRMKNAEFPSVGRYHAPAIRLERALRDLYGACAARHRRTGGRGSIMAPGACARRSAAGALDACAIRRRTIFCRRWAKGLHQIPVGPVHAGIIEPGHFRFTANGETVVRLEERLGYVHKGIDGLLTDTDIERAARVVARISGDSTVAYSFAFARAVEEAMQIDPPPRAKILRGVMAELERIANHLGDIGAICNDASFSIIHAHCGIFRERVLAAADRAFGHRLMMDRIVPGGTEDAGPGAARGLQVMLDEIEKPFAEIVRLYDDTPSLAGSHLQHRHRQQGSGRDNGRPAAMSAAPRAAISTPAAIFPMRPTTTAPFEVPVFTAGDVDARVWVRIREIEQSISLLKRWLANLPAGPTRVDLQSAEFASEGIAMTEAFRGDVLVWVRIVDGRIARCHARDASWFQWPLLEAAIENNIVADFPLCNKSFNCSYSGHDL